MVKTRELKQRAIYVYPPAEMAQRWKQAAKQQGTSISRFIIEHVENSLAQTNETLQTRANLLEENKRLRETLKEKEKRVHHLELLVDRLEEDLRHYRSRLFTQTTTGVRTYDRRLVEILKQPGSHTDQALLSSLGVNPDDVESVKAVARQLENLEAYGLVRNTGKGWVWTEV